MPSRAPSSRSSMPPGGRGHQTCGGRALNDDVMDTLFTLLINAGTGPTIRDGVDHSTRPASRTFPYLATGESAPPDLPTHCNGGLTDATLDLDDIQSGVLHARRPLCRHVPAAAHRRSAGRTRSGAAADPARQRPARSARPGGVDHRRFHLSGSQGARRPAGVARQLRAGFQQGMAARATDSATSARAAPSTGRSRWEARCARRAGGALPEQRALKRWSPGPAGTGEFPGSR